MLRKEERGSEGVRENDVRTNMCVCWILIARTLDRASILPLATPPI